eukprot:CAMPEP_0177601086 /NCGR_PEP_ID=MMETSP0419_2-20121207/14037_1 /TAXON_ID=582737 /ORGANISM="Tetraselmis sp., Strain GSL018" /LENGTH=376 /DNA_ID=CAMNT_0019094259 /DNA_START=118 /DNA_END=1245 /DNA_ORIENTATION=-
MEDTKTRGPSFAERPFLLSRANSSPDDMFHSDSSQHSDTVVIDRTFEPILHKKQSQKKTEKFTLDHERYSSEGAQLAAANPVQTMVVDFSSRYSVGRTLGVGTFSVVKEIRDRHTGASLACKIVPLACDDLTHQKAASCKPNGVQVKNDQLDACSISTREDIWREILLLRRLDHPNIISVRDVCEDMRNVYIISDLLKGGELLHALAERGSFAEEDAREIFMQLLLALKHMHSRQIVHRDVKLENIILVQKDDLRSIKLIDFGLATTLEDGALKTVCGTPQYVAPEVLHSHFGSCYGSECDLWSAGVVLFNMLSGYPPFHSTSVRTLLQKVAVGSADYCDPVWELISTEARSLLKALLTVDPKARITIDEALSHAW